MADRSEKFDSYSAPDVITVEEKLPGKSRLVADLSRMEDLRAAREAYLSDGTVSKDVRAMVLRAWERCIDHGVHPRKLHRQMHHPRLLQEARTKNRALLDCADPLLEEAHAMLKDIPHLIALSNRDGFILRLLTDPETGEGDLDATNLFEGASWHERDIGCNGVGTALVEDRPVILFGPEHFQEAYVNWTCIGVPIRNREGEIAGVLDLSVPNRAVRVHTWGWILSVARTIEAAFSKETTSDDVVEAIKVDPAANPMHAVRGVLEFVVSQVDLPSTLDAFVEQARLEARVAERHMLRRRADLQLANRNKEVFLATLAHELAGPVAGLQMSLSLMTQKREDAAAFAHVLEQAERLSDQLSRLLHDLRDVSSISQGKIRLEKATVDIAAIIDQAVASVRGTIEAHDHHLAVEMTEEPLLVRGDFSRLVQVLTNLLTNAAKYTRPGGQIWVSAARAGDDVTLRVRDTGMGISPDFLPKLFDLFVQDENGNQDGLGLGLHLVDQLVSLHGGTVEAHSDGLDMGSEFIIRLPAVSA